MATKKKTSVVETKTIEPEAQEVQVKSGSRSVETADRELNLKKGLNLGGCESGGGGGGGTTDYTDLSNKPQVNSVTLSGNKSASDLGLATAAQGTKADTAVQQVTVGTTTTGNAGTNASVTNSGTATAPVLDFTIPRGADGQDGADAVNPFKGWFASTASLPANPVVGDYAYVKGASSTDPAAIYECTTDGSWSDSGRTADTSNVQTFASGEEVNEVHIVNNLNTGGVDDVLSAEQGKNLKTLIDRCFDHSAKTLLLQILKKAVYVENDVESIIDNLEANILANDVLYIDASFTQPSQDIYIGQDLDTLKQYLVVTAHYDDGTSEVVTSYVLSGYLSGGNSTITVSYSEKSTTFNVIVSYAIYMDGGKVFGKSNNILDGTVSADHKVYDGVELAYVIVASNPSSTTNVVNKRGCYGFFDIRCDMLPSNSIIQIEFYAQNMSSVTSTQHVAIQCYNASFASDGQNNIAADHSNDIVYDSGWLAATKDTEKFYVTFDTSNFPATAVGYRIALKATSNGSDVMYPISTFNKLIIRKVNNNE